MPIYLNSNVKKFLEQIARNRKTNISSVVNQLLKFDIKLAQAILKLIWYTNITNYLA